ncbi:N-acetyl-beta-hexosaminidase [Sphingobium sp. B1D7B]|uniref:hypothetical protein n=1 Tax=Sphingobium sp. B1D7B TaxID=2940578 RepID=UPI002224CF7A|nr:hypothetical protein [Sphingobium sp. B1D7B]MCW2405043.1 N-acetyl-beta-hexosaminidase [Sphingobium sp. B1D7B]
MRQDAAQQAYDRLMQAQRVNAYDMPEVETPEEQKKRWETLKIKRTTRRNAPA